jgi:hypothetical protein
MLLSYRLSINSIQRAMDPKARELQLTSKQSKDSESEAQATCLGLDTIGQEPFFRCTNESTVLIPLLDMTGSPFALDAVDSTIPVHASIKTYLWCWALLTIKV